MPPESPAWPPLSYLEIKRRLIGAGVLSCSQQGFNIAIGSLSELRGRLAAQLSGLAPVAVHWATPALIRADWVELGAWDCPPAAQWCRQQPAGHLLTARPLAHLLNRLRHHPADRGAFLLAGECFRSEQDTLPLLRQSAFTMLELVWLGRAAEAVAQAEQALAAYAALAAAWELPVQRQAEPGSQSLMLALPATDPVPLARLRQLSAGLLAAYKLELPMYSLGLGLERWCLALVARHGLEPAAWPPLPGGEAAG